jgi:hypothetical protein
MRCLLLFTDEEPDKKISRQVFECETKRRILKRKTGIKMGITG